MKSQLDEAAKAKEVAKAKEATQTNDDKKEWAN